MAKSLIILCVLLAWSEANVVRRFSSGSTTFTRSSSFPSSSTTFTRSSSVPSGKVYYKPFPDSSRSSRQLSTSSSSSSGSSSSSSSGFGDFAQSGGDLLSDISKALSGATDTLDTIIAVKKDTILPALQNGIRTTKGIIDSPVVKQVIQTKQALAKKAIEKGPELIDTAQALFRSAGDLFPTLFRAGTCALVCPFRETEFERRNCRNRNCGPELANSGGSSSTSSTSSGNDDTFNVYGDADYDPNNP